MQSPGLDALKISQVDRMTVTHIRRCPVVRLRLLLPLCRDRHSGAFHGTKLQGGLKPQFFVEIVAVQETRNFNFLP